MGEKFLSFILHALSLHLHHGVYMCVCVLYLFVVVQSPICVWLFVTPWTAAHQISLSSLSPSLLKLMSTESVMPSNHLIFCRPLSFCPQSFPASESFPKSRLFTSGSQNIRASASASNLPMNIQGWFPLSIHISVSLSKEYITLALIFGGGYSMFFA